MRDFAQTGIHWRISPAQAVLPLKEQTPEALCLRILANLVYENAETAHVREADEVNFALICLALKRVLECWDTLRRMTGFEHKAVLALAMSQAPDALGHFDRREGRGEQLDDLKKQLEQRLAYCPVLPPVARALSEDKVDEFCRADEYCRVLTSTDGLEYGFCPMRACFLAFALAEHGIHHISSADRKTGVVPGMGLCYILKSKSDPGVVIELRSDQADTSWWIDVSDKSWGP
ncbi:hypothetical protein V8F33_010036 [Rhypophila sp. PSN 637]